MMRSGRSRVRRVTTAASRPTVWRVRGLRVVTAFVTTRAAASADTTGSGALGRLRGDRPDQPAVALLVLRRHPRGGRAGAGSPAGALRLVGERTARHTTADEVIDTLVRMVADAGSSL